jgi:hypothetical protein
MSDMKVFHGVTPAIFACLKTTSEQQHGTKYVPPDGNKGTATTSTSMYKVELGFDFSPDSGDLTYTLIYKSWIVPIAEVWKGIGDTIDSCRKST